MTAATRLDGVAEDVMQRDVLTISAANSLRDALELMTENHVGALPVMDRQSRCIGLVAATDILNYEQEHSEEIAEGNAESASYFDAETGQWETIRLTSFALEQIGDVRVSEVMARDLVSVVRNAPLRDVAKTMCDAGVHRVLVLDDSKRLYGIISALDFVKLFAQP